MQIGLLRVYEEEYAGRQCRSRKRRRKKGRTKAPETSHGRLITRTRYVEPAIDMSPLSLHFAPPRNLQLVGRFQF
jgi:hypothetical protein